MADGQAVDLPVHLALGGGGGHTGDDVAELCATGSHDGAAPLLDLSTEMAQ